MDKESTGIEGETNSGKRKRQQDEPTGQPPEKIHTRRGAYRSKIITRSTSAMDRAIAQSEQNEYVPQNHRIYSPLNRALHELRLLVLKAGQPHTSLSCHLLQMSLAEAEEIGFETISYCWGDPKDQAVIDVEGFHLRVPISAIELLQQFRYQDRDRHLWIDSICLNQLDLEERGHEVARMHHIYSKGQRNLIWLGLDNGTAAAASRAIHAIMEDIESHPEITEAFCHCIEDSRKSPEFPDHVSLLKRLAAPFIELLSRPWFSRLWVVQEAVLAKRNLIFCGNVQLELVHAMRIYRWIERNLDHLWTSDVASFLLHTKYSALLGLSDFTDPDFGWSRSTKSVHFFGPSLEQFRELDVSDPRDHVYGILGLFQSTRDGNVPLLLRPDYSKDALTVFRDATRYGIYEAASLLVQSWTTHRIAEVSSSQRRPLSWVPRWNQKFDGSLNHMPLSASFDASLGMRIDRDLCGLISSDVIDLRGLFIDQPEQAVVRAQSEICEDLTSFFDGVPRCLWLDFRFEAPRDAWIVLWRVLVAGIDREWRFADVSMAHTFLGFLRYFQEHQKLPPTYSDLPSDASDEALALSNYRVAFSNACHRRRLFRTAGGRLGLGPQTMQPGDVAVILYGGNTPYILRYHEDANDYESIGECYIDGVMFGEAVEKHREEGREDVIFNIR